MKTWKLKLFNLSKYIGVDIVTDDLIIYYRLPRNGKHPRPAILIFVERKTKVTIMQGKKNLNANSAA